MSQGGGRRSCYDGLPLVAAAPFMFRGFILFAVLLVLAPFVPRGGVAQAAEQRAMAPRPPLAVSVAFDAAGRLWRVRMLDDCLVVDVSADRGATFAAPVRVTAEPVAADGEQRPEIALGAGNEVYVAWTTPLPEPYAGYIRFARSLDGGRSFEAPLTVNDNRAAITHRFQSMQVAPDGRITLVWIDKRDLEAAKLAGTAYRGAALYTAVSTDGGASFGPNTRLAAHSCECCRIALASDSDGRPVAFWRHVFADGTRDHALVLVGDGEYMAQPATRQGWKVDACPHHGPDLAIATDGTRHGAWFSVVGGEPGLFYGAWDRAGLPLAEPLRFGAPNAAHPALLVQGLRVLLAWKAFDGENTVVSLMESADGGRHWSAPRAVATAAAASDHPRLVAEGATAYLSWSAAQEGYRLIPLASSMGSGS